MAVNELENTAEIIEIKRNATKINMNQLNEKSVQFRRVVGKELEGYTIQLRGLSMEDM